MGYFHGMAYEHLENELLFALHNNFISHKFKDLHQEGPNLHKSSAIFVFILAFCVGKQSKESLNLSKFKHQDFESEGQKIESRGSKSESEGQELKPQFVNMNCNLRGSKSDSRDSNLRGHNFKGRKSELT